MGRKKADPTHIHKTIIDGKIHTIGFLHPIHIKHKDCKTKMLHDITIKIDTGKKENLTYGEAK